MSLRPLIDESKVKTAAIHWKKTPGRLRELTSAGPGFYAWSADKRFAVIVSRRMIGGVGFREYAYVFGAVDYALPSKEHRFTDIPLPPTSRSDPKKVMVAIGKWAEDHPITAENKLASGNGQGAGRRTAGRLGPDHRGHQQAPEHREPPEQDREGRRAEFTHARQEHRSLHVHVGALRDLLSH